MPYLNARPLFETLDGVELEVPSILSARFAAGEFDAALIPIFAVLERGGGPVVDDVAIACDGAVHSVFLAYRGELKDVRSVAMDPASRTSVNLLRCLLRGFRGIDFSESSAVEDADQARLLIGDPAMAFREAAGSDWNFFDLGEEWRRQTGLPFVFACWAIRHDRTGDQALADALRSAKRAGLARLDVIAGTQADPEFARHYLTESIRFDFGEREKESVGVFVAKCRELGLLKSGDRGIQYL